MVSSSFAMTFRHFGDVPTRQSDFPISMPVLLELVSRYFLSVQPQAFFVGHLHEIAISWTSPAVRRWLKGQRRFKCSYMNNYSNIGNYQVTVN